MNVVINHVRQTLEEKVWLNFFSSFLGSKRQDGSGSGAEVALMGWNGPDEG